MLRMNQMRKARFLSQISGIYLLDLSQSLLMVVFFFFYKDMVAVKNPRINTAMPWFMKWVENNFSR